MSTDNVIFAVVVYALVWVVLLGYLLLLARRQADLEAELNDLARNMRRDGADAQAAPEWAPPKPTGRPPAAVQEDHARG